MKNRVTLIFMDSAGFFMYSPYCFARYLTSMPTCTYSLEQTVNILTGYHIHAEEVKMKYAVLPIVACFLLLSAITAVQGEQVKPSDSFAPSLQYEVENLEAILHKSGHFTVSGEIRNTDAYPTLGYVIVYFANDRDEVIAVAETIVNDKKAIDPGSAGHFELSKKVEEYKKITKTFIEYVVQEKIVMPKKPTITIGSKK